jgi:hypothetical protein
MVIDGNVSPLAGVDGDADVPTELRMGSDSASAATLRGFLQLCGRAAARDCAFSAGSPAATTARYAALLGRLRSHPVTVSSQANTYASTVSAVDDFLYTTSARPSLGQLGWKAGAQLLESIWDASASPGATAAALAGPVPGAAGASQPYSGSEQVLGVECADSPNPSDPAAYAAQAGLAARASGAFGPLWAWRTEPCASWPGDGDDRYAGPWNRPTATPVLVLGNTGDPATPYAGAVTMAKVLARGRLLTVDQFGHTALLNGDACAVGYVTRYLLTGMLPRAGTVCPRQDQPFAAGQ